MTGSDGRSGSQYNSYPKVDTLKHVPGRECPCGPQFCGTTRNGSEVWAHNEVNGISGGQR